MFLRILLAAQVAGAFNALVAPKRAPVRLFNAAADEPDAQLDRAIDLEISSSTQSSTIARSALRQIEDASVLKRQADTALRGGVELLRAALTNAINAANNRQKQSAAVEADLDSTVLQCRSRATSERDLVRSLTEVAKMTPEPSLSASLAGVAAVKAELVDNYAAIADDVEATAAAVKDRSRKAADGIASLTVILATLPPAGSDAVLAFSWVAVSEARATLASLEESTAGAIEDAKAIRDMAFESRNVRSKAIRQVGKVKGPAPAAPAPAVSSASVREAASAAADAAAALGDWLLSPAPDVYMRDVALRAQGLTKNFGVPSNASKPVVASSKPAEVVTPKPPEAVSKPASSVTGDMPYAAPPANASAATMEAAQ